MRRPEGEGDSCGRPIPRRTSRALRMQGATCSGGPVTISRIMESIPSRCRSSSSTMLGCACVLCVLEVDDDVGQGAECTILARV